MSTPYVVMNWTRHSIIVDGVTVPAQTNSQTVSIQSGVLALACTDMPAASCNLVSLAPLQIPLQNGTFYWNYSYQNMYAGPSSCTNAPLVTFGAFSFLTFAVIDITLDASITFTSYTPQYVPASLFQMIGNPVLNPLTTGTLPSGLYNYAGVGSYGSINPEVALVPNAPFNIIMASSPYYYYLKMDTSAAAPRVLLDYIYITKNIEVVPYIFCFVEISEGKYGLLNPSSGYYVAFNAATKQLGATKTAADAVSVGVIMSLQTQLTAVSSTTGDASGVVMVFASGTNLYTFDTSTLGTNSNVATLIQTDDSIVDLDAVPGLAIDQPDLSHTAYLLLNIFLEWPEMRAQGALNCFAVNTIGCPGGESGNASCFFLDTQIGSLMCGATTPTSLQDSSDLAAVIQSCSSMVSSSCAMLDGTVLNSCTGWSALGSQTLCAEACNYAPATCDAAKKLYCIANPDVPECACLNLNSNPTPASTYGRSYAQYVCDMERDLGINPQTQYHGQCWWPLCDAQGGALTLSNTHSSSACPKEIAECYTLLANNRGINVSSVETICGLDSSTRNEVQCNGGNGGGGSSNGSGQTLPISTSGLSKSAIIGIAVGVSAAIVLALGIGLGVYFHRRKRTPKKVL